MCSLHQQQPRAAVQVMHQLSNDLARSVLKAAPATLDHLLAVLPADLHLLAVQTCYPSIFSDGTLTLDCNEHTYATLATVLRTHIDNSTPGPPIPSLQRLKVQNIANSPTGGVARQFEPRLFLEALQAACLTPYHVSLSILSGRNGQVAASVLVDLMAQLVRSTALRSLELTASAVVLLQGCAAHIADMSSLLSLTLVQTHRQKPSEGSQQSSRRDIPVLTRLTQLTHLHLDWDYTSLEAVAELLCSLQHLQSLEISPLCRERFDLGYNALSRACTGLSQLTSLVVARKRKLQEEEGAVSSQSFHSLEPHRDEGTFCLQALGELTNLRKCDLSGMQEVKDSRVEQLVQMLRQLRYLEDFSLNLGKATDSSFAHVVDALQAAGTAHSCTKLTLISDTDCSADMCEALRCLGNLQNVTLSVAKVVSGGDSVLLRLSHCLSKVTSLKLTWGDRSQKGDMAPFLRSVLPNLTNLQHLESLGRCLVHQGEYRAFASALEVLCTLQSLAVGCQPGTYRGDVSSANPDSLAVLTSLTRLRLFYSPERGWSGPHIMHSMLGQCMTSLVSLQSVEILDDESFSPHPNEFAVGLANCLPTLKCLLRFKLTVRWLSGADLVNLLGSMQSLTQLQCIDVCASMPAAAAAVAASVLRNMHDLREVRLHPLSEELELLRALSHLTRLTCVVMPCFTVFGSDSDQARSLVKCLRPLAKLRLLDLGSSMSSGLPVEVASLAECLLVFDRPIDLYRYVS